MAHSSEDTAQWKMDAEIEYLHNEIAWGEKNQPLSFAHPNHVIDGFNSVSRSNYELTRSNKRKSLDEKFCISIVFIFSRDHCKSQEKLETMLMQNLERQTKSIMVFSEVLFSEVAYSCASMTSIENDCTMFLEIFEKNGERPSTIKTCEESWKSHQRWWLTRMRKLTT